MSFLCPVGMPMVFYVHPPMVPVFQAVMHSSQDLSVHPISHIRAGEYICCCPLSLAYQWSHKQKGCGQACPIYERCLIAFLHFRALLKEAVAKLSSFGE